MPRKSKSKHGEWKQLVLPTCETNEKEDHYKCLYVYPEIGMCGAVIHGDQLKIHWEKHSKKGV